jgi:hypothetical protein
MRIVEIKYREINTGYPLLFSSHLHSGINRDNNSISQFIVRLGLLILFSVLFLNKSYSQDYDLIVTKDKDSIACHIDSITGNAIYFRMRYDRKWVHTYYTRDQVQEYKLLNLSKEEVVYKRGSSFIINPESKLINHVKRNSIYGNGSYLLYHYSITLNFERIIHINDLNRHIWSFRLGAGNLDGKGKIVLASFNNLIGKGKNKFETNIGAAYINEPHSYGPNYISPVLSAGYRKQSPDGKFLFRTGFGIPEGLYLSFGYQF